MLELAAAIWILSAPATSPAPKPAAAPPSGAGFEVVLSEELVQATLSAAAPFEESMEQEVGALGITHTVTLSVRLTNPRVRVGRDGVKVTLDYTVRDGSGLVDLQGVATPRLTLVAVPARGVIEGRLSHSGILLPGGSELPLEGMVKPIELPAVFNETVDLGEKTVPAEARATEVILEDGRVRLKGTIALGKPKPR